MQKSDFVSITIIKLYFYNQIIYLSIVCMLCFLLILKQNKIYGTTHYRDFYALWGSRF